MAKPKWKNFKKIINQEPAPKTKAPREKKVRGKKNKEKKRIENIRSKSLGPLDSTPQNIVRPRLILSLIHI